LLHLKDCDLERLSEADFEDDVDEPLEPLGKNALGFLLSMQLPCHIMVALKHVELAILSMS